ncbi:MAG: hypothetical protein RIQ60_3169 [Pseudomonadota bacterium]|jgi:quercetin dioxygenase-like cupin family protein
MPSPSTFQQFQAQSLADGYDVAVERVWAPDTVVDEHTHPFDTRATVMAGELWLTVAGQTRHIGVGEGFDLAAHVPHSERYGPQGATYWVARRNVPA